MIKKGLLTLVTIFTLLIGINTVDAASVSISSNKSSVIVGNTVTFTVTINGGGVIGQAYGSVKASSNLTLLAGSSGTSISYYNGNNAQTKTLTYTYKYKANASGTASITVSGVEVGILETGNFETVSTQSKNISIVKSSSSSGTSSNGTTSNKKEYSKNNNLSSITIEGYDLNPKFNKDTTEYKLTVDESVEKIKITAKTEDTKASVKGAGEINLSPGTNTIELKVIAENGNEKKYKIVISVEDLHPIKVKIDKKEFTVVKKNNDLIEPLENFKETTIKIDEQDTVVYSNPNTNVTLVILKDKENKLGYYIYNAHDNSYEKYNYISINNVNIQLLSTNEKLPNFEKYQTTIHDVTVDIYKIKKSHKVGLIYGVNTANGNTGYYVYDKNEDTLSKYYDEEINIYKEANTKLKNTIMILVGSFSLILIIILIVSLVKNKRKKYRF